MRTFLVLVFSMFAISSTTGDCPPGQYNPGPDCSFERICALPSAHTYRRHYCDCWCGPGTIRDSISHRCVKEEDCPRLNPYSLLSDTAYMDKDDK